MDLNQMMEKAKELQKNMQAQKEKAAQETVEAQVGGGMIKIAMNGNLELLKVEIDPEVIEKEEKETLEDLVRAAVNEGIKKAQAISGGNGLNDLFAGMNLPDLANFKFPGQ